MNKITPEFVLSYLKKWPRTWEPEYRIFVCGICERKIRKAWHCWVKAEGYNAELHLCNKCGKKYGLIKE